MKRLLLLLICAGCASTDQGQLELKAGVSFAQAQPCGGDAGVCTMPAVCSSIDLASGAIGPYCVPINICAQLTCTQADNYCVFNSTDDETVFKVDCVIPE